MSGDPIFEDSWRFHFLRFGFWFLPGAEDHAGNLRSAHALTGSMFFLRVEFVIFKFFWRSRHAGIRGSAGFGISARNAIQGIAYFWIWLVPGPFWVWCEFPGFSNPITVAKKVSGSHCTHLRVHEWCCTFDERRPIRCRLRCRGSLFAAC